MGAFFGLMTALTIGLSDLFGRRVVILSSPLTVAAVMQLFGGITAVVSMLIVSSGWVLGDVVIGLASGVGMAIGLGGYYTGLARSSATVIAPVVATLAAVIPFLYALVRGEPTSAIAVLGACVAFIGLVLITIGDDRKGSPGRGQAAAGIRWAITSGLGYGFAISALVETSEISGSWPAVGQRVAAFFTLAAIASVGGVSIVPPRAARGNAILAGLVGGFSTVFLLIGIQLDAPAAVVAASMFPAFSVAVGRVFFGDPIRRRQAVGIAVVLLGIAGVVAG